MIIYALFDEATPNHVRYVGQTRRAFSARLSGHLKCLRNDDVEHKANWIRSVVQAGRCVNGRVLMIVEPSEASIMEQRVIALLLARGHDLTNATSGGEEGKCYSGEVRRRMSASAKARCTPEWRAEVSTRARMQVKTPAAIQKWRENNIGKHAMSDEHRAIVSASQTGRQRSPEELERQRTAHLGHVPSAESRRKNSEGVKRARAAKFWSTRRKEA